MSERTSPRAGQRELDVDALPVDTRAVQATAPSGMLKSYVAIDVPQYARDRHTVLLRLPWSMQSPIYAVLGLALIPDGGSEVPFINFQF